MLIHSFFVNKKGNVKNYTIYIIGDIYIEIEKFKDAVMKKLENPDAELELSDEDLEDVAGGCLWIAIPIAIGIINML